jgi:hypothetical protein
LRILAGEEICPDAAVFTDSGSMLMLTFKSRGRHTIRITHQKKTPTVGSLPRQNKGQLRRKELNAPFYQGCFVDPLIELYLEEFFCRVCGRAGVQMRHIGEFEAGVRVRGRPALSEGQEQQRQEKIGFLNGR